MNIMLIPAAGRGSRLGAAVPKLLYEVAGRPMIDHVLARHAPYVDRFVVVVSPEARDTIVAHLARGRHDVAVAVQERPTGMLDAILDAAPQARNAEPDSVCITWCDQVAISDPTARTLAQRLAGMDDGMLLPTVSVASPYIHFDRDDDGRISAVRQRREGDVMPERGENDCGLFGLTARAYFEHLPRFAGGLARGTGTGERNFLPFIPWLAARAPVATFAVEDPLEALGVNTADDARAVEAVLEAGR